MTGCEKTSRNDIEIIEAAAHRAGVILERAFAGQNREALVADLV